MADIITICIVVVIVGLAIAYIIKKKKQGVHCIGCPQSGSCSCGCNKTSEP